MKFLYEDPKQWFDYELAKAIEKKAIEPTAMSLATVSEEGFPQVRVVLFKGWRNSGLSFFTNYRSPKGLSLILHKKACLNFFWPELAIQIRIQGEVKALSESDSDEYFATRPRLSQIGAWASSQSQALSSRDEFDNKVSYYEKEFINQPVTRPPHWGGFTLLPINFEFWFGQEGRLHERYYFSRKTSQDTLWSKTFLYP